VLSARPHLQVVSGLDFDDQSFLEAVPENPRRLLTIDPGNAQPFVSLNPCGDPADPGHCADDAE
jgi:hypothetical protein